MELVEKLVVGCADGIDALNANRAVTSFGTAAEFKCGNLRLLIFGQLEWEIFNRSAALATRGR